MLVVCFTSLVFLSACVVCLPDDFLGGRWEEFIQEETLVILFSLFLQLPANKTIENVLYCYCFTSQNRSQKTVKNMSEYSRHVACTSFQEYSCSMPNTQLLLAALRTRAVPVLCVSDLRSRNKLWDSYWDFCEILKQSAVGTLQGKEPVRTQSDFST